MSDTSKKSKKKKQLNNRNKKETDKTKNFDKKTYRLQKYSYKYKVDQWENRRKKAVLRTFFKDCRKNHSKGFQSSAEENENNKGDVNDNNFRNKEKKSVFSAAKEEFQKKIFEKQAKREQSWKNKAEYEEALNKYKLKKKEAYQKLSRKTKKGQPVMKDRLEMLLEKIKESKETKNN